MSEVDHVHFERVTFMSGSIDMVLVNKDRSKAPTRVDMIPNSDKDNIQEWLSDMEYSYTEGPMNLNWKSIMQTVADDDRFYMNTHDDEVTEKDAGWDFLRMYGKDDDEEGVDSDEDDSEFSDGKNDNESSEETGGDDSEESDFDSEPDEESDFDGDEELEEQGMDWDDMEKEAAADDRRKRQSGGEDNVATPKKRQRVARSGGKSGQSGGRRSSDGGRPSGGRAGQSGGRAGQSGGRRRR